MKVKIKNIKPKVEVGDIIQYNDYHPCIITSLLDGKLKGYSLNGEEMISNPQDLVDKGEAILYKQNEWELVLQRIF